MYIYTCVYAKVCLCSCVCVRVCSLLYIHLDCLYNGTLLINFNGFVNSPNPNIVTDLKNVALVTKS